MKKAIVMTAQDAKFLIETDDTVELPERLRAPDNVVIPGLPKGMQPVADFKKLERDFADVNDVIVSCCNSLFEVVHKIPKTESLHVEFGVKLAGEAGVPMLTKASGEAAFKISIQWKG